MSRVRLAVLIGCVLLGARAGWAQGQATLAGAVIDSTGAVLPGATVTLLLEGQPIGSPLTSGSAGEFSFQGLASGRYQVRAELTGFSVRTTAPVFLAQSSRVNITVGLQIGPLEQRELVTASAAAVLESQTGAPVTVIDSVTLDALNKPDVLEALRLVPGAQVVQTGQRGGGASLYIRGGESDFNKVLVDGLAVNDIGGGFDVSHLATAGVEQIEVLRQSNSVVYGSDALSGVVSLTTRRGRTRTPELTYSIDGGTLGTFSNNLALGGARGRFDYFSQLSHFDTDNNVPNNDFRNRTYAGRFGVALGAGRDLSATIRHTGTVYGSPGAIEMTGIPDDSRQDTRQTYFTLTSQSQWTNRWQSTIRFGLSDQRYALLNPSPTGEAFDPFGFGANYLGNEVTLTAADGRSVTGRAILDFGGMYPVPFESRTTRRAFSGQATFQAVPSLALSAGARVEREAGYANPDESPSTTRTNGGLFIEARASLPRTFVSAGVGYEHNEAFKGAVTPRLSLAAYLRTASAGALGETKLVLNAGTGIKAPAVYQDQSSLFGLLQTTPTGSAVEPIGPERSRNFDIGIEQALASGRARARIAYFHNEYRNLIEFVSNTVLPQLGVPQDVAAATGFGAYVNSSSYKARGVEMSLEAAAGDYVRISGSYTFLDAEVTESFSGDALAPAINPAFPGIEIGAFGPLVGARPFRRPTNSGTIHLAYLQGPVQVSLSGYFAGKRDDSTFLSDAFFGNSMLLPNTDLAAAYQKFDLAAGYQVHPRVRGYVSLENLFDQEYSASYGYPSLPRTARAGLTVRLGGDR